MGNIMFEGDPPFELLDAKQAKATPTRRGIEVTADILMEVGTVPIRILLQPEAAAALAQALEIAAGVVERWQRGT